MAYVDGFVIAVPTKNKDAYKKLAVAAWNVFRKHGALRQVECWGDDVPEGKLTSFTMAVKREADETIVFSWMEWASKEARDAGHKKAMEEFSTIPEMAPDKMPFDGKRMIFGGFQPMFDERA